MKLLRILLAVAAALAFNSMDADNTVTWETLGNRINADSISYYTQRFVIEPDGPFDGLAFCIVKVDMTPVNPADTVIEILPGYVVVKSPRFALAQAGDEIVVELVTDGYLAHDLFTPGGVHLVKGDTPVQATYRKKPATMRKDQWVNPKNGRDGMIYGDQAYRENEKLKTLLRSSAYRQIPTPKKLELSEQMLPANQLLVTKFNVIPVEDERFDYWKADISGDGVNIATNSRSPEVIVADIKRRISESMDSDGKVPAASIEDWADYDYRGFMFDVGRNFFPKEYVFQVIDLISDYGLNTLHFHLGEDEGWRLEIPSLPELTQVGSRRGYTLTDDVPFLKGIYFGDGNPDSPTTANGYYTVKDYIDILKYADKKGVRVVPEFDTPGHSRAAIRAMEWRAKATGDSSLRLIHDGDTSQYSTAQSFHDNTMNPALEGPYKFWSIVMDDIIDIYNQAGVPLIAINIGGDEVAQGVWDGSDKAQELMKEKGMGHQRELHAYFNEKVAQMAREKGVKIAGWSEIAEKHSASYDSIVAPEIEYVNVWNHSRRNEYPELIEKGYPVVLSNVDLLYFDHNQTTHPEEPGMSWGGSITEFSPLFATVDRLVADDPELQSKVKGISAQLFSESVQNFPMVERYMLPRLLGLAERAHNSHATLEDEEYFGLITEEMPRWNKQGRSMYLRQPGIIRENGYILMNEPYGLGDIHYTLDGTEPTIDSPIYTGPITDNHGMVRARLYYGNSQSATSILFE